MYRIMFMLYVIILFHSLLYHYFFQLISFVSQFKIYWVFSVYIYRFHFADLSISFLLVIIFLVFSWCRWFSKWAVIHFMCTKFSIFVHSFVSCIPLIEIIYFLLLFSNCSNSIISLYRLLSHVLRIFFFFCVSFFSR